MHKCYAHVNWIFDQFDKVSVRHRALWMFLIKGYKLKRIGKGSKIRGANWVDFGEGVCIGDYCWIEAVYKYQEIKYRPNLTIGDNVAVSDLTHISCMLKISIGDGCLFGSKIYIGDHSHGRTRWLRPDELACPPAQRELADAQPIYIGANCWLGDGAVILAGTHLAAGSIVAANSVVRLQCERAALIAGAPARVVHYLDEAMGDT